MNKYGYDAEFKIVDRAVEVVPVYEDDGMVSIKVDELPIEVVYFEFNMPNFVVGNYTPVAVIDHGVDEKGNYANLIHKLDSHVKIPKEWYNISGHCDDCNDRYSRKTTVMLLNNDDKTYRQIGTTCLKKYLGINCYNVIHNYVDTEEYIIDTNKLLTSDQIYKDNLGRFVDTEAYLCCVLDVISEKGCRIKYVTTKEAYKRLKNKTYKPTEKSVELVKEIRNYFKNLDIDTLSDFDANVVMICTRGYTKINEYISWFYDVYNRLASKNVKKNNESNKENSEFVGNVGDMLEAKVIVKRCIAFESYYGGYSYMHIFEDIDTGNIYTWTTSTKSLEASADVKYAIKGRIKDHKEYKGTKQTVLTRVKMTKID